MRSSGGGGALCDDLLGALDEETRKKALRVLRRISSGASVPRSGLSEPSWQAVGGEAELFDYQEELREKVVRTLTGEGVMGRRGLIAIPTGGGKTRTAAMVVRDLVEMGAARTIYWVAPGHELLFQARDAIMACWKRRDVGRLELGGLRSALALKEKSETPKVIFMTAQWLGGRGMDGLSRGLPPADLIVFDEAHHAVAPSYLEGLEALSLHGSDGGRAPLLGLSATPGRRSDSETKLLADFFDFRLFISETLGNDPIPVLQSRGVLAEVSHVMVSEKHGTIPRVVDWRVRQNTTELMQDPHRYRAVLEHVGPAIKDGRMLLFSGSIAHAEVIAAGLIAMGIRTAAVTSATEENDRRRFLRWFREDRIRVLVNKDLLTTGFDLPGISSVFLTVPILSAIRYEQIIGRAIRGPAVGGSERAEVFQFERHEHIHGDLASYSRYWDSYWRPE